MSASEIVRLWHAICKLAAALRRDFSSIKWYELRHTHTILKPDTHNSCKTHFNSRGKISSTSRWREPDFWKPRAKDKNKSKDPFLKRCQEVFKCFSVLSKLKLRDKRKIGFFLFSIRCCFCLQKNKQFEKITKNKGMSTYFIDYASECGCLGFYLKIF